MREALQRQCLWWVCLAAAARVAGPKVAGTTAEMVKEVKGQGQCEVLSLNKTSPEYLLPTNLTVRPLASGWRLGVTIEPRKKGKVCVRLEDKEARLRLTVVMGSCDEGDVRDYSHLNVSIPSGVWTSLRVDVVANTFTVSTPDGSNIAVVTHGSPLPRDSPQVALTWAMNVEAAVGCRVSCPGYRHASLANDKRVTVKKWSGDSAQFYFRPGKEFVKLEYEVACTTPLGHKTFPQVADITLDSHLPLYLWHQVNLQHHSGQATVLLDHRSLKNKTLPGDCIFNEHTIKVMGDSLFSFICNPNSGDVDNMQEAGSSVECLVPVQAGMHPAQVGVIVETIVVVILLLVILNLVRERRKHQLEKQSKATTTTTNNTTDNNSNNSNNSNQQQTTIEASTSTTR